MKQTINLDDFRQEFKLFGRDYYTYSGYKTLLSYFEEIEESSNNEIELDVIAICCEFTEYTIDELFIEYSYLIENQDLETLEDRTEAILFELNNNTTVLPTDSDTYIIGEF